MSKSANDRASQLRGSPWDESTSAKIDFLCGPGNYPDKPRDVEVIETHYAWVFMTGRFVYKLKKPVKVGAIDFTSLALRKRSCDQELRLNRRLAARTYLTVVPLTVNDGGELQLDGAGTPIEWMVKMRQLPRDRMMDTAVKAGTVTTRDIVAIVEKLVRFYDQAPVSEETDSQFRGRLENQLIQTYQELSRPEFDLNARLVRELSNEQLAFLRQNPEIFKARVDGNRVREVHGDLKPEHVCLVTDPQIIDRLEFDRQLRVMDCVEEIAFLAMECAALGGRDVAKQLLSQYRDIAGDDAPRRLIGFYLSRRAVVRAMLAAWHLHDVAVMNGKYWHQVASRYARKACHYLRRPSGLVPDRAS
jgi:aminoglycoside phosphotransferase family enzyme